MSCQSIEIEAFCETGSGTTPSRDNATRYYGGGIGWVKSGELREGIINTTEETVTEAALRETSLRVVPAGAILVAMYGATVGRVAQLGISATTNQAVCHVIPNPREADARYLFRALQAKLPEFLANRVGGAQPNISQQIIRKTKVALPPLPEQRRISAIVDAADALRAKRRQALAKLDELAQSIFLEMFGDPATNLKGWPTRPLGELATKFSDGPFGSNLKTSHYTDNGVRVIRLQNVGVGEFLDDDKAFISEDHFNELSRHECMPGDVIVGTLGDPNLRACILPPFIEKALNKADCVQIRTEKSRSNAAYVCALLNTPSTERMAHGLILGQTRSRISMGRLRELQVPVPPIGLQCEFSKRMTEVEQSKTKIKAAQSRLESLFASLQHRAFRGAL